MKHQRNKFSLSHKVSFSCDQGELIPCSLVEVLPGDIFRHGTSLLIRLSPMLAPMFSQLNCSLFQMYVPHRLVWDNWEDFITGGEDGDNDSTFPTITFASGVAVGSLGDYFGLPPSVNNLTVSALPFRAYALCYNEWFRDQDLQTKLTVSKADGNDTTTSTALQYINWEKDYFTSARPWEQKGPQVTIPIGNRAPVLGIGKVNQSFPDGPRAVFQSDGTNPTYADTANIDTSNTNTRWFVESQGGASSYPNIYADLSQATGIPVSELRLALSLQRFEEISARYGSRYVEYLMSRFGVRSSDARLQRPELLSRSKQVVQISEVLSTAETDDTPVGSLKGHGIGSMRSNRYMRHFEEHGYVITFLAVQPKTMYVQGLNRTWNRRDKYDFFQQETQHVGQQEILNKELYAAHAQPDGTFGYQDRYDEYRRQESRIAGEFRSTLDFWHQARIFGSAPALNSDFVKSNPTERVFAVPSEDVLYITAHHSIHARRVISKVGTSFIR